MAAVDPWTADIAIDAALARALISGQFPEFRDARVEAFSEGWDNAAFLADGRAVFRFPRRKWAVPLLEHETAILPAIAARVPLAVPAPEWIGAPSEAFPYVFAGYRLIPGRTADRACLDDDGRAAIAPALGRFLAALHAIPPPPGAVGDEIGRLDLPHRAAKGREKAAAFRAAGTIDATLAAALDDLLAEGATLGKSGRAALVHGDLYSRHLLVDGAAPAGVIDWGDVHVNDPAIDLSLGYLFFPPTAREAFFGAYGGADDATLRVARFRAACHSLAVLPYALQTADAALERETRAALGWTAGSSGRRST